MERFELVIVVLVFLLVVGFIGCTQDFNNETETKAETPVKQKADKNKDLEAEVTVVMDHEEKEEPTSKLPESVFKPALKVHFIDVGHGDAALIQTPNKANILIDCGDKNHASALAKYLRDNGVDMIHALIVTHPDSEHYGGCEEGLDNFVVKSVYDNGRTEQGRLFQEFQEFARKTTEYEEHHVELDYALRIDPAVRTEFITAYGLYGYEMENKDDNSLMFRVTYKSASFLFMGDCEEECEEEIVPREELRGVDVLKIGHHGARTASNKFFLEEVKPQIAVLSVGYNNRERLPHQEALDRIKATGATLYRTDKNGNIVVSTDGKTFRTTTDR